MTTQPAPYQPLSDSDARSAALQILGTDLDADHIVTGDWHKALKDAAARWTATAA